MLWARAQVPRGDQHAREWRQTANVHLPLPHAHGQCSRGKSSDLVTPGCQREGLLGLLAPVCCWEQAGKQCASWLSTHSFPGPRPQVPLLPCCCSPHTPSERPTSARVRISMAPQNHPSPWRPAAPVRAVGRAVCIPAIHESPLSV